MSLNRRSFLQASSLATMAASFGFSKLRGAETGASSTNMQLGLVTYQWGKDWDVPQLIENCTAAKFSGVELRTSHKHGVELVLTPQERAEVKKRFADSPVQVVGIGSACEYHSPDPAVLKKNIEETKAFIQLSHDIGGTGVKVRPNGLPKDVPVEKTIQQIGEALNEVAKYAGDFGQEIRLEIHGKETSEIPITQQIMQVATHPLAKLCWNCNPSDLKGPGLKANFESLQSRIATVHIHDLTKDEYPWQELFTLLKAIPFEGWTLLEEGKVPADILPAMKANRTAWEKLTTA